MSINGGDNIDPVIDQVYIWYALWLALWATELPYPRSLAYFYVRPTLTYLELRKQQM